MIVVSATVKDNSIYVISICKKCGGAVRGNIEIGSGKVMICKSCGHRGYLVEYCKEVYSIPYGRYLGIRSKSNKSNLYRDIIMMGVLRWESR